MPRPPAASGLPSTSGVQQSAWPSSACRRGGSIAAAPRSQRGSAARTGSRCGRSILAGHDAGNRRQPPRRSPAPAAPRAGRAYRDDAGRGTSLRVRLRSTCWPAYWTITRSAVSATTPMSWVMSTRRHVGLVLQREQEVEDLRLDRDVERGRRLVGDQELRAGRRCAMAIITRWRHAARQLVRECREPPLGIGDADLASTARATALRRLGLVQTEMRLERSRRSGSRP